MPVVKYLMEKGHQFLMEKGHQYRKILSFGGDNCFITFLLVISTTIPIPSMGVKTIQIFLNLDKYSKQNI